MRVIRIVYIVLIKKSSVLRIRAKRLSGVKVDIALK